MYDAAEILLRTDERTNKAILGVGYITDSTTRALLAVLKRLYFCAIFSWIILVLIYLCEQRVYMYLTFANDKLPGGSFSFHKGASLL